MKESIQSIKDSLTEIFTSPEVQQAANRFANILAINLGKVAGFCRQYRGIHSG